jgi:hypothetical protein
MNKKSEWLESSENGAENAYQAGRTSLEKLARAAKKIRAVISS